MLEINNLSSSGKKINNLTLLLELGGKVQIFPKKITLLLFHNIVAHVPIIIAKNDTILCEYC